MFKFFTVKREERFLLNPVRPDTGYPRSGTITGHGAANEYNPVKNKRSFLPLLTGDCLTEIIKWKKEQN
jgi:hypothetical protein